MTYDEAIKYIHSLAVFGSKPGLSRVSELCAALQNPQKSTSFIHVAGTNGKGSVCSMLSEILKSAGYKTGLYTSPYISFFEERIRINGEPIPKNRLAEITGKVKCFAEKLPEQPTEFEIITAAAFLYFSEENCDIVVLETGLGGRLDATNIIEDPILSVITGIGLDHTAVLGNSIAEIAAEKGGIIKSGRPVVMADCPIEAQLVLESIAKEKNSPVFKTDYGRVSEKNFSVNGTSLNVKPYGKLAMSLAGVYQADNAIVAITAAETARIGGLKITEHDIKEGLSKIVWPARFELFSKNPPVIYDGAHNPNGVSALKENIERILGGRVILVTGVMKDKDYSLMAKTLAPLIDCAFTVTPDNPRSLSAKALAEVYSSFNVKAKDCSSAYEGILLAISESKKRKFPVVISGTLYMYAEAKDAFNKLK